MSSQKKPSIWQRFKKLLTVKETSVNNSSTNNTSSATASAAQKTVDTEQLTKPTANLQGVNAKPVNNLNDNSKTHNSDPDHADKTRPSATFLENSEKPITDSILDFLEASDLNYYYHQPTHDAEKETSHSNKGSTRNVHHISMSMRYYNDDDSNESSADASGNPSAEQQPGTEQSSEERCMEWGCVIRVHEHTQLVAFYGVLPVNLPESHLQAGMLLATQLNYDMMLGCVEIDIRDGEVRFKNSVDFEPIFDANAGKVPPQVIDYLLKGVMAMTASFAPLFSDFISSDPQQFDLDTLLNEMYKAQMDKTFFLPTQVRQ